MPGKKQPEEKNKKTGLFIFRKKGLVILFFTFLVTVLLSFLLTDRFIERQIEHVLTQSIGAKAELDGFHLNLLNLNAGWNHLQVTDPQDTWKNIIETGKAEFNVATEPLFYGKIIIEEIRLEELRNGTNRETDGKIHEEKQRKPDEQSIINSTLENMTGQLSKNTGIDFSRLNKKIDVNSVIETMDFQTFNKISALRNDITAASDRWKTEWNSIPETGNRLSELKKNIESLKFENLKNAEGFVRSANTLKNSRNEIISLENEFRQKKQALSGDISTLETGVQSINKWIDEDIQQAKSKANLPDFNAENISAMLFGEKISAQLQKGFSYLKLAHNYYEKLSPSEKIESPPRFKGQDITFRNQKAWPRFWIKNLFVSSASGEIENDKGIMFSGAINDLTSDQKKTGEPTTIDLKGSKINGRSYSILAELNYTEALSGEDITFDIKGISLANAELGGHEMLPDRIRSGMMNVSSHLNITGGELNGTLNLTGEALQFIFNDKAGANQITRIAGEIFQSIDKLDLKLKFSGSPENLKLSMNSSLDDLFSSRLNAVIGGEIKKGRAEIEKQVRLKINPEKEKILTFYTAKKGELDSRIAEYETLVAANFNLIEQKKTELEKRIDNEKNPLLKQALRAVKNIMKW